MKQRKQLLVGYYHYGVILTYLSVAAAIVGICFSVGGNLEPRPGIGITGYSYDDGQMKGAYVYTVVSGGPADKAGLKPGDVIIKAGDKDITTIDELKETLQSGKIGDSVTLTYIRNGSVRTTQLVLEELNAQ